AVFLPELGVARAWERAGAGDTGGAQTQAMQAAQTARKAGMHLVEMRARHAALRFGDRAQAARVDELASILNSPSAQAVADHAR
ncbi:hypothetical protein, partial [Mycobacterium avium]|uniref:hypothetical protein n=1 Tax=Mycobacterium avium TaxID=1764 RepID=UPI00111C3588